MFNKELVDKVEAQSKEIEQLKKEKNDLTKKFDKIHDELEEEVPKIRMACIETREKVNLLFEHFGEPVFSYLTRIVEGVDALNARAPSIDKTEIKAEFEKSFGKIKEEQVPELKLEITEVLPLRVPLLKGEVIYTDRQARNICKDLWKKFEEEFLDGKLHSIREGKDLIRPYYKKDATEKYILTTYGKYTWYAIHKRGYIKKAKVSNGTFLYRFSKDKKKAEEFGIKRKKIVLKRCDIFENHITKKVNRKYGYKFYKKAIKDLSKLFNEQTEHVWESIDLRNLVKEVLSKHFSYVADGRVYAYIDYFKESGLFELEKGKYYLIKDDERKENKKNKPMVIKSKGWFQM